MADIFNLTFLNENVGKLEIINTAIKVTHNNRIVEYSSILNDNLHLEQTNSTDMGNNTKPAAAGEGTPIK